MNPERNYERILGTLTREQFNQEIASFFEKSEVIKENWCTREAQVIHIKKRIAQMDITSLLA